MKLSCSIKFPELKRTANLINSVEFKRSANLILEFKRPANSINSLEFKRLATTKIDQSWRHDCGFTTHDPASLIESREAAVAQPSELGCAVNYEGSVPLRFWGVT